MSTARFRVRAQFDSAGPPQDGTVEINREQGWVRLRALRSHRVVELPLSNWVDMAFMTVIRNEVHDAKVAKKALRRRTG